MEKKLNDRYLLLGNGLSRVLERIDFIGSPSRIKLVTGLLRFQFDISYAYMRHNVNFTVYPPYS